MSIEFTSGNPNVGSETLLHTNYREKTKENVDESGGNLIGMVKGQCFKKEKFLLDKEGAVVARDEASLMGRAMLSLRKLIGGDSLVYHMAGEGAENQAGIPDGPSNIKVER